MMHEFLFVTTLLCVSHVVASDPAPERSEIRIKLTMLALDSSVTVPEVISDPQSFADELRRQQKIRWSERFILSAMENGEAKFHSGDLRAVATGSTAFPQGGPGDRTPGRSAPARPADNNLRANPDVPRAPASFFGRSASTFKMESTGTAVSLTPSIDPQGRLFVDANIASTRVEDAGESNNAEDNAEDLPAKWCIRKLSVQTTLYAAPGKPVLLRVTETDAGGILPDQTVLILMDAQIVP
jgi:hypothetical protein